MAPDVTDIFPPEVRRVTDLAPGAFSFVTAFGRPMLLLAAPAPTEVVRAAERAGFRLCARFDGWHRFL